MYVMTRNDTSRVPE